MTQETNIQSEDYGIQRIINPETQEYQEASQIVSLGKLFDLLHIKPSPMQQELINLYDNRITEWSECNLAASRRSGKTFTVAIITVLELLKPHSSTILISKSAKSLTNNFNEIVKFVKQLGLPITKLNTQQYQLTVNGNSHLRCSVHKQMDNLLGARASHIILDESGVYNYTNDYDMLLAPMRLDFGTYSTNQFVSKVLRVSSPRTIGSDFYNDWIRGIPEVKERKGDWLNNGKIYNGIVSFKYNIYDSPLVSPQMIEALKNKVLNKQNGENVWKTEYLAEFIHASASRAFSEFSVSLNTYNEVELIEKLRQQKAPKLPLFIGVDVGFTDRSAIVAGLLIEGSFYILESYSASGMRTAPLANKIKEIINKYDDISDIEEGGTYVDPAAALTRADLADDYDVENLPAFNRIKWGIDTCNQLFKQQKIFIPQDDSELINHIETLAYKESAVSISPETKSGDPFVRLKGHHNDLAHAFRYLIASVVRYWGLDYQTEEPEG